MAELPKHDPADYVDPSQIQRNLEWVLTERPDVITTSYQEAWNSGPEGKLRILNDTQRIMSEAILGAKDKLEPSMAESVVDLALRNVTGLTEVASDETYKTISHADYLGQIMSSTNVLCENLISEIVPGGVNFATPRNIGAAKTLEVLNHVRMSANIHEGRIKLGELSDVALVQMLGAQTSLIRFMITAEQSGEDTAFRRLDQYVLGNLFGLVAQAMDIAKKTGIQTTKETDPGSRFAPPNPSERVAEYLNPDNLVGDTDITVPNRQLLPRPLPTTEVDLAMGKLKADANNAVAEAFDEPTVVEASTATPTEGNSISTAEVVSEAVRVAENIIAESGDSSEDVPEVAIEQRILEAMGDTEKFRDALLDEADLEVAKKLRNVLQNWNNLEAIDASDVVWNAISDQIDTIAKDPDYTRYSQELEQIMDNVVQELRAGKVDGLVVFVSNRQVQDLINTIDQKFRGLRDVYKEDGIRTSVDTVVRSEVQIDPGSLSRARVKEWELGIKSGSNASLVRMRNYMKDEAVADFNNRLVAEKTQKQKAGQGHAGVINQLFGRSDDFMSVSGEVLNYQEGAEGDIRNLRSMLSEMQNNSRAGQDGLRLDDAEKLLNSMKSRIQMLNDLMKRLATTE